MLFKKFLELVTLSDRFNLLVTKSLGLFLKLLHAVFITFHLAKSTLDLGL